MANNVQRKPPAYSSGERKNSRKPAQRSDSSVTSPKNPSLTSTHRVFMKNPAFLILMSFVIVFLVIFGIFASRIDSVYQAEVTAKRAEDRRILEERIKQDTLRREELRLEQQKEQLALQETKTVTSCTTLGLPVRNGNVCCTGLVEYKQTCYDANKPYIKVTSPLSGAVLPRGVPVIITWESIGFTSKGVRISLNNTATYESVYINVDAPNTGSYTWNVNSITPIPITQGEKPVEPGTYTLVMSGREFTSQAETPVVLGGMPGTITIL